jgi:hypothetical protein
MWWWRVEFVDCGELVKQHKPEHDRRLAGHEQRQSEPGR